MEAGAHKMSFGCSGGKRARSCSGDSKMRTFLIARMRERRREEGEGEIIHVRTISLN